MFTLQQRSAAKHLSRSRCGLQLWTDKECKRSHNSWKYTSAAECSQTSVSFQVWVATLDWQIANEATTAEVPLTGGMREGPQNCCTTQKGKHGRHVSLSSQCTPFLSASFLKGSLVRGHMFTLQQRSAAKHLSRSRCGLQLWTDKECKRSHNSWKYTSAAECSQTSVSFQVWVATLDWQIANEATTAEVPLTTLEQEPGAVLKMLIRVAQHMARKALLRN